MNKSVSHVCASHVCVLYKGNYKIAWVTTPREADTICDTNTEYQWDFIKREKCVELKLALYNDLVSDGVFWILNGMFWLYVLHFM